MILWPGPKRRHAAWKRQKRLEETTNAVHCGHERGDDGQRLPAVFFVDGDDAIGVSARINDQRLHVSIGRHIAILLVAAGHELLDAKAQRTPPK